MEAPFQGLFELSSAGSCGLVEFDQSQIGASFWREFGAKEFRERISLGRRHQKFGKEVAQGVSDDQSGGGGGEIGRAQPTAKEASNGAVVEDGQVLEQALDNEADLDVPLIGREFATGLSAVAIGLPLPRAQATRRPRGSMWS